VKKKILFLKKRLNPGTCPENPMKNKTPANKNGGGKNLLPKRRFSPYITSKVPYQTQDAKKKRKASLFLKKKEGMREDYNKKGRYPAITT